MDNKAEFTIRVYGVLMHENRLLLSYENYMGKSFVKFPGGGLQHGEGVLECLEREFLEELNLKILEPKLLHVTESRQISAFHSNQQVIAIYYIVDANGLEKISSFNKINKNVKEQFSWVTLEDLSVDLLSFESDKEAAIKLITQF